MEGFPFLFTTRIGIVMSNCPQDTLDLIGDMTQALKRIVATGASVTFDGVTYSNHNLTTLQDTRDKLIAECTSANSGSTGRKTYGRVVLGEVDEYFYRHLHLPPSRFAGKSTRQACTLSIWGT